MIIAGVRYFRANAQLNKVKGLQQELSRELPPEERREKARELGQAMRDLTPDQRQTLRNDQQQRFFDRLDAFFKLTPDERIAQLDSEILRREQMRQRFDSNRGRQQQGAGANRASNNQPGRGFRGATPDQRDKASRQRLDNTGPEQRAQMAEYRRLMQERRKALGLGSR
jgi:hypothetical protein